jgi:hypothetical protein
MKSLKEMQQIFHSCTFELSSENSLGKYTPVRDAIPILRITSKTPPNVHKSVKNGLVHEGGRFGLNMRDIMIK